MYIATQLRIDLLHQPSCCGKAIGGVVRSKAWDPGISRTGLRRNSTRCVGCSVVRSWWRLRRPSRLSEASHTACRRRSGHGAPLRYRPSHRRKRSGHRHCMAMIVAPILNPQSKLATARASGLTLPPRAWVRPWGRGGQCRCPLHGDGSAPAPPTPDRSGTGHTAPERGDLSPVRPHVDLLRRAYLFPSAVWT